MAKLFFRKPCSGLAALVMLVSCPAAAQDSNSMSLNGQADAMVVEPISITPINDLRFGALSRPTVGGIVEIAPGGAVTSNLDITTFPTGRGPARFTVLGDPNRLFLVFMPNRIDISNGTATMAVDRFRANTNLGIGLGRFDNRGSFDLYMGGRLNVNANQAVGDYSGTFQVTVLYL